MPRPRPTTVPCLSDPLSRRALVAATAAGWAALSRRPARAQSDAGLTRAGRWVEAEEVGVARAEGIGQAVPEPIAFATPWPVWAVAPHWSGKEPAGATVEVAFSADGQTWSDPVVVGEDADHGRPGRASRRYGPLLMTRAATFVRYRSFNAAGRPAAIRGLAWEYIDASVGPGSLAAPQAAVAATPTAVGPPPIVSRAAWGADESLRFMNGWEIWPPEYALVEHVVVHHSDTANFEDPLLAVRSIYYYHAVTKGWGDIGYNYLVDFLGNVYEGRAGGETVVGGHAAGYNIGTCGICTIGRYVGEPPTPEMWLGLTWITAWATRNLDPVGEAPFLDIASLPTICAHRDVNPTACPGDTLYGDLGDLRLEVRRILNGREEAGLPVPAFAPGEVVATTEEGVALRDGPGLGFAAVTTLALGEQLTVADGPATNDGLAWYQVQGATLAGWVAAVYLTAVTPAADPDAAVGGMAADGTVAAQAIVLPAGTIVAVSGGALNLRDAPAGAVLETLPDGAWLEITGPPEPLDGVPWYPVDTGLGTTGWVNGEFVVPVER